MGRKISRRPVEKTFGFETKLCWKACDGLNALFLNEQYPNKYNFGKFPFMIVCSLFPALLTTYYRLQEADSCNYQQWVSWLQSFSVPRHHLATGVLMTFPPPIESIPLASRLPPD